MNTMKALNVYTQYVYGQIVNKYSTLRTFNNLFLFIILYKLRIE